MHRGAQLSKSYNNHVAKFVDSQPNMVSSCRTYVDLMALVLINPQTIEHSSAEIPPSYDYVLAQAFSSLSSRLYYSG
jgi:hypothetical protein